MHCKQVTFLDQRLARVLLIIGDMKGAATMMRNVCSMSAFFLLSVVLTACGGQEPDPRCESIKNKLATCSPASAAPASARCESDLLAAYDVIMATDCNSLNSGKADWLSFGGCGHMELPCGPFDAFCCDQSPTDALDYHAGPGELCGWNISCPPDHVCEKKDGMRQCVPWDEVLYGEEPPYEEPPYEEPPDEEPPYEEPPYEEPPYEEPPDE